jgi:hypothetical protein
LEVAAGPEDERRVCGGDAVGVDEGEEDGVEGDEVVIEDKASDWFSSFVRNRGGERSWSAREDARVGGGKGAA